MKHVIQDTSAAVLVLRIVALRTRYDCVERVEVLLDFETFTQIIESYADSACDSFERAADALTFVSRNTEHDTLVLEDTSAL